MRNPAQNRQVSVRKMARAFRPYRYMSVTKEDRENVRLVRERVKCGKPSCRCARGQRHGPYTFLRYQDWGRGCRP
jgi:hypothetical protein